MYQLKTPVTSKKPLIVELTSSDEEPPLINRCKSVHPPGDTKALLQSALQLQLPEEMIRQNPKTFADYCQSFKKPSATVDEEEKDEPQKNDSSEQPIDQSHASSTLIFERLLQEKRALSPKKRQGFCYLCML